MAVTLIAILLLGASALTAQANRINFEEYDLDNGLHVILVPDKSAAVVTSVLHYNVGSRNENPKRTGFAHFFEHLMFEATTDIPRASIDKIIQEAGGVLNAHTSFDETVYFFTVPSNEIRTALWIDFQRMRGLKVTKEGVETQRGVVKEERKGRYDNSPYGVWQEKMFKNLFQGGSYGWTPIGSSQHIDSASIPEFQAFYDTYYQPNNACLVVCGDFDFKIVKSTIQQYFGSIPRGPSIKKVEAQLPPITGEYRETVEDRRAQMPGIFIGYRGAKLGDADSYALEMLTDILSSGESSRMYRRCVDKDQTAIQSSLFPWQLQYGGVSVMVGIGAKPDQDMTVVENAMYEEIERVKKEGVTEEEFQKAKNIAEAKNLSGKKTTNEKAQAIARYYWYSGSADMINREIEFYNAVKREDLQRVANKYFSGDNRCVLTFIPKSN